MRFSIPIVAFGLIAGMAGSLPLWGQSADFPSADARESYREHLRAASSDSARADSSTEPSETSYKEQLRRMAEGDEAAPAPNSVIPKSKQSRDQSSSVSGLARDPVEDVPRMRQGVFEPASIRSSRAVADITAAPVAARNSTSCQDAYCKQLVRVANGVTPAAKIPVYEPGRTPTTEVNFLKNLAFDQMHIWTSPFKLRDGDAAWVIPFGVVTGSLIATDRDISKQLSNPGRINKSKQISNLGLYSFIGAGAGMYGLGVVKHNDHQRETGLLAGEAFINATLVAEALKMVVGRQRPFEGDHFGHIGKGGSSFPSGHAIDSWAVASVLAREYPNPLMQIGAYGLASAVSVARITAQQHYASDVVVGSAFGYLIGRKIYRDHHNPDLPGAEYGTFIRERHRDAENSGSAYVPLESWVYPVIDRLAGLGFVRSNFDSERPFTRLECARLTAEAADNADLYDGPDDIRTMVASLQQEFAPESQVWAGNSDNRSAVIESLYTRATEISGPVLSDGYHFGQTLYNDYGRPYGEGFNSIMGFTSRATAGPLLLYFRGEYQHAPPSPAYTPQQQALIGSLDVNPVVATEKQFQQADRFRVLDAYIGISFGGNQLTLGQQSLWWGPGTAGPFMLTNNAEPLNMVRLANTSPVQLPLISKLLGPFRYEMFLGQTAGYHYLFTDNILHGPNLGTQPFLQGQRFSFKPTKNLDFGIGRTGIFGGTGTPFTVHELIRSTFSLGNTHPGQPGDPGDRRSFFDISYKIPRVRDLIFYLEEFADDEYLPVFVPRRSAMHPGVYLARLPKMGHVDLRVEGIYTDPPSFGGPGPRTGFFYTNLAYLDGYRKNGDLLGSWIGREGRGIFATSTIWLSPRNTVQLGYREAVADQEFIEGGRYQDESVKASFTWTKNFDVSLFLQHENWHFPALASGPQVNFTSSLQITYRPRWNTEER